VFLKLRSPPGIVAMIFLALALAGNPKNFQE